MALYSKKSKIVIGLLFFLFPRVIILSQDKDSDQATKNFINTSRDVSDKILNYFSFKSVEPQFFKEIKEGTPIVIEDLPRKIQGEYIDFNEFRLLFNLALRLSPKLSGLQQNKKFEYIKQINELTQIIDVNLSLGYTDKNQRQKISTHLPQEDGEIMTLAKEKTKQWAVSTSPINGAKLFTSIFEMLITLHDYETRKWEIEKGIFLQLLEKTFTIITCNLNLIKLYLKMNYVQSYFLENIEYPQFNKIEKSVYLKGKMFKYVKNYCEIMEQILEAEKKIFSMTGKIPDKWIGSDILSSLQLLIENKMGKNTSSESNEIIETIQEKLGKIQKQYTNYKNSILNNKDQDNTKMLEDYMYHILKQNLTKDLRNRGIIRVINHLLSLGDINWQYNNENKNTNTTVEINGIKNITSETVDNKKTGWKFSISAKQIIENLLGLINLSSRQQQQHYEIQERARGFFMETVSYMEEMYLNEEKVFFSNQHYLTSCQYSTLQREKMEKSLINREANHKAAIKANNKLINMLIAKYELQKNQLQTLFIWKCLPQIYEFNN